jgi:hypothetical protein
VGACLRHVSQKKIHLSQAINGNCSAAFVIEFPPEGERFLVL